MFKFVIQLQLLVFCVLFSLLLLQLSHIFDFLKMIFGFGYLLLQEGWSLLISLLVSFLNILHNVFLLLVNGSLSINHELASLSVLLLQLGGVLKSLVTFNLSSLQLLLNFIEGNGRTFSSLSASLKSFLDLWLLSGMFLTKFNGKCNSVCGVFLFFQHHL